MLFSVNFFELIPITDVIGPNGPFAFVMLTLFLCFTFNRRAWIRDSKEWLVPFWWFLAGILLSTFPALIYYGQSLGQSFFTYRRMFQFLAFPIFIAIRPTEKELRSSLQAFSVIYLVSVLFVTFIAPTWIRLGENQQLVDRNDYVHSLEGIRILSLAFVFSFHRLIKDYNRTTLVWALFIFGVLFLIQNRTSLIAVIIMVGYAILTMKASTRKIFLMTAVGIVLLLMFVYTAGQWGHLYQETIEQIFNPEYNRNKAYIYMFSHREWIRYLLGDGFISANVNPFIPLLQENGIFFSDVGLVGMWYQFGIIPVMTVLIMSVTAFTRHKSFLVRACAIYLLVGAPTMSYFGIGESLLWLSVYLYTYYSDGSLSFDEPVIKHVRSVTQTARYRSIAR